MDIAAHLIGTDDAVLVMLEYPAYIGHTGETLAFNAEQAQALLYRWSHEGRVVNYGGSTRGTARWAAREVVRAMGLTVPGCPGRINSGG